MAKLGIIAAGALAFLAANAARAHDYHTKDMTILHPWARPAAERQNAAAYLIFKNAGGEADRFVAAESPVAEKAELHETRDENGVMTMRAVKEGVEIKPGSSLEFKPGGYHIMLVNLKKPLEAGAMVPLTITLERAGAVKVEIKVEKSTPAAAEAAPMNHSHH